MLGLTRHLREALHLSAELHPWLRTVAVDLRRRLHPAWIVQRADLHHDDAGQRLPLIHYGRAAVGTEPAEHRLAAVTFVLVHLQVALQGQCGLRDTDHNSECAAAFFLTVAAMAYAGEDRFRVGTVAHLAAQAAADNLWHD